MKTNYAHEPRPPELDFVGLLYAMIAQETIDLQKRAEAEQRRASEWLFLEAGPEWPQFLWCCEALALDPIEVRGNLKLAHPGLFSRLHLTHNIQPIVIRHCDAEDRVLSGAITRNLMEARV